MIGIVFLCGFACFVLQWFILGVVFKNLKTLSFIEESFFSPRKKVPSTLYLMSGGCMIAAMVITNNYIFPEAMDNDQTAVTMLVVFNILSFVALIAAHFVIGYVAKNSKQ
jgi:hypothetical protein